MPPLKTFPVQRTKQVERISSTSEFLGVGSSALVVGRIVGKQLECN